MTGLTCTTCRYIHPTDGVRVVGRFTDTPRYRANYGDAPLRDTRAEAERDLCDRLARPRPAPPSVPRQRSAPAPAPEPREAQPFPAATMETAARAKAWRDFLAEARMSLEVWRLDPQVRAECEDVRAWLRRCRDDLAGMTGMGAAS